VARILFDQAIPPDRNTRQDLSTGGRAMVIYVISYLVTVFVFVCLDALWLNFTGDPLYRAALGGILRDVYDPIVAAIFYVLYAAGITIFAVAPAFDSGRWSTACFRAGLFGFFAYATYDLTNQATLKNWSTGLTLADLGWGVALTALSATFGFLIASKFRITI
jgi:uncharacterized membrane protein